jgi:hypothetical protein
MMRCVRGRKFQLHPFLLAVPLDVAIFRAIVHPNGLNLTTRLRKYQLSEVFQERESVIFLVHEVNSSGPGEIT